MGCGHSPHLNTQARPLARRKTLSLLLCEAMPAPADDPTALGTPQARRSQEQCRAMLFVGGLLRGIRYLSAVRRGGPLAPAGAHVPLALPPPPALAAQPLLLCCTLQPL